MAETIKIRLLQNLPVDPKHGAMAGNVYDAEFNEGAGRGEVRYWMTGADGGRVGVLNFEAEVVNTQRKVNSR